MIQNREITGIVLQIKIEKLKAVAFCKVLTPTSVEQIKLPTIPENYKYQHLIQPSNIIRGELVLTRKNWILTTIHQATPLIILENYSDFIKYSEMIGYLDKNLKEGEQTDILEKIIEFTKDGLADVSKSQIFEFIDISLGFGAKEE